MLGATAPFLQLSSLLQAARRDYLLIDKVIKNYLQSTFDQSPAILLNVMCAKANKYLHLPPSIRYIVLDNFSPDKTLRLILLIAASVIC